MNRVYTDEQLKDCSKPELEHKLNMVNTSIALSQEEVIKNRDMINLYLNDGVHHPMDKVIKDIQAGKADTDDIGVY